MKKILSLISGLFTSPSPKVLSLLWLIPIISGAIPLYVYGYVTYEPYGLLDYICGYLVWVSVFTIPLMVVLTLAKFLTLLIRRAPGPAFSNLLWGIVMFLVGVVVFIRITHFFG